MRGSCQMKVLLLAGVACSVMAASAARAEAPADKSDKVDTVQTVVVTARRRAEALQEVPATVTAISGADLRERGVTNIRDIVGLVPNAVIQDSPNNLNTFINIRGMQQVNTQAEPNVGLYRNGLYASGERENLGAQVDIERV